MEKILGKFISKIIFFIYSVYFLVLLFFYLRDISELIQVFFISQTQIYIIAGAILLTLLYVVCMGIEPLARYCIILFYITIVTFVFFSSLLFTINKISFAHFLPFLPNGIKPILKVVYLKIAGVPMGELFVLLLIIQYIKPLQKKQGFKSAYIGLLLGASLLLIATLQNIIFIEPEALSLSFSPAMRLLRRIDLEDYIQRLDLIVLNIIIFHAITKMFVYVFATKELIENIVPLKKPNLVPIIICPVILVAIYLFGIDYNVILNFRMHFFIPYVNTVFEIYIPLLIILISFIRRKAILKQLQT